jgi:hypothetical protein
MEMMTQPKVTGYRQLTEEEGQLMNEIKALGQKIEGHIAMVESHLRTQKAEAATSDEAARIDAAQPMRWVAIARTEFQQATMALTRAVAQPTSF